MACQTTSKALKISVGADAPPLYTLETRYPRIIHSELMTHRVFSRNARSSRAVPFARLVEEVMDDPFIPRYWGANQKGMQAGAEHETRVRVTEPFGVSWTPFFKGLRSDDGHFTKENKPGRPLADWNANNVEAWLVARDLAVMMATRFHDAGYHKQIVNRLLEPFMHIDVLITTTDIKNFLWLRDDPAAEPHIRDLAKAMASSILAYGEAQILHANDWHLPYVSDQERQEIFASELCAYDNFDRRDGDRAFCVPVSVTRCARISYKPFHGEAGDIASEIARHDQLIAARPMHASPCEHQATPDFIVGWRKNATTGEREPIWEHPELHGNLVGWKQYRKMLPGERA